MPLSVRMDGLIAKVTISALLFFVPQDAAAFFLMLAQGRATSKGINQPQKLNDVNEALEQWKQKKGIENAYTTSRGKKTYVTTRLA